MEHISTPDCFVSFNWLPYVLVNSKGRLKGGSATEALQEPDPHFHGANRNRCTNCHHKCHMWTLIVLSTLYSETMQISLTKWKTVPLKAQKQSMLCRGAIEVKSR